MDRKTWLAVGAVAVGAVVVLYELAGRGIGCSPLVQGTGRRVLLVGDSLAVGLDKPFRASAAGLGHQAMVAAKVSTTMSHWLGGGGLSGIVASFRPDVVLVCLGTNDSKTNYTEVQLAEHVSRMLATAGSTGAKVGWILPPSLPFPDRVGPIVRATGVSHFDSSTLDGLQQADGIHPSGAGAKVWNEAIWRWVTCT